MTNQWHSLGWVSAAHSTEWKLLGPEDGKGLRKGPGGTSSPCPSTHLTVLQEGKEPLQLGHQGLGVVLGQAEHTVSKASNETGKPMVSRVRDPLPPIPEHTKPVAAPAANEARAGEKL